MNRTFNYPPQATGRFINGHEAAVAVDPAGTIDYTWVARHRLPYLAVSRNGGKTFGEPLMVSPPGIREASLPAIDVGGDGKYPWSTWAA
jgi:hypothetical protein